MQRRALVFPALAGVVLNPLLLVLAVEVWERPAGTIAALSNDWLLCAPALLLPGSALALGRGWPLGVLFAIGLPGLLTWPVGPGMALA